MSEEGEDAISSLINSVYQDVWDEFYAWEQGYSKAAIRSLHCDLTPARELLEQPNHLYSKEICTPRSYTSNWVLSPDSILWDYPKEDNHCWEGSTNMIDYKVPHLEAPEMDRFPSYESISPSSTNVFVGDDSDSLPFVPFPGEVSFQFEIYYKHYDDFAWQKPRMDPDGETIVLESTRRLERYHDIPIEEIRRILSLDMPFSKLGERDLLQWLPFQVNYDDIPRSPSLPRRADTEARFEGIVNNFCPNLNCIEAFCALHETNPPKRPPNHVSLEERLERKTEPCGPECFLLTVSTSTEDDRELEIVEPSRDTISMILDVCPNLTSCQLAIACRSPCRETHAIRQRLNPPEDETPESGEETVASDTVIEKLNHFTTDYEPDLPCHHLGPCDSSTNCSCYLNKAYCEKSCRCSPQCMRRFRGCECRTLNKQKPNTCGTKNCACLRSGRECDPEVCVPCKMDFTIDLDGRCRNSQIQRGETKRTIVKGGKYGMGLFLDEPVHRGDLILEYTGELIFETTVDCRDFFNVHRGRSYLFKLNETLTVDASKLGNESRYINHDRSKVNCGAKYVLVNGIHRIGIFATKSIKRGTELHLDYGNEFFVDQ